MLAVLVGLGIWQLDRLEWKRELIERIERRVEAEPVALLASEADLADLEYRRVRVTGRFLHDREQFLVGRSYQGQTGYEVMTPLALPDGRHLFVNRGWIPLAAKDATRRPRARDAGVTVTGIIRLAPELDGPGASRGDEHYRLDLRRMAAEAGLDPATLVPFYVVAGGEGAKGMLPVPRPAVVEVSNNHLQYALTWFGLAAALVAIYVVASIRR